MHRFVRELESALTPPETLSMTRAEIRGYCDQARKDVDSLKKNPLFFISATNTHEISLLIEKNHHGEMDGDLVIKWVEAARPLGEIASEIGFNPSLFEQLDYAIRNMPSDLPRGVLRPGRGDSKKRHFCVYLTQLFSHWYNNPFVPIVAQLAAAVFEDDTSEDYVRKVYNRSQT